MFDKYKDECGVFGIFGHPEAANLTYLGLYALQHRGQESAGIVSSDGYQLHSHKAMGLVADIFREDVLRKLSGHAAIGHVRYSTTGESHLKNAQPFVVDYARGGIAVAHNGNLVNVRLLRDELEAYGSIFQSTMDTEIIVHLVATSRANNLTDRIADALKQVKGSYSLVFLTGNQMVAVRDPNGFRPLALGRLKDAWVIASETCAFDLIEAEYVRDIEPGEMLLIDRFKPKSFRPFDKAPYTPCIFEFIYFARPDSHIFGANVYNVRKNLGRELAKEYPVEADIVIPVPDSGVPAAIGFSEEAKIPFQMGLIRNHYVGRTFIEPKDAIRHFGVKIKLNAVKSILKDKKVVVIDDSIVRGTTSRKIVRMIRDAGAKEVHMRISSPPTICPCFYGIDTPTKKELIASSHMIEEITTYITADSLKYLSIEGLYKAVSESGGSFCDACFTGKYPVEFPFEGKEPQMALFK
ncbi:MAG TPA: amidophosphoribosyltransferase [Deltaproteobacteria bacterium]|nr:MAG: amidophosphoribosyltransferase [Deltaproteobacteria bacterium GWD2_42_10]OGP48717.1 MAG: amidophosphoribosyltransferase [Deltaproteobacteria bacterium GWF2_42_12]OGQ24433.1 MAG: amidophosphoribosyltransferase [Deltaproteobacteria bacterium RIFCSPHIGHO2_02_FULL_42_44]OGQ37881.1 MAG: amidophosphoribosyltransferase [Deltaproteobacteria bacterium RIFCSPLOWO2_02_FULL_42_39]OGQ68521.1 MAG: amidophosphoribosyltransferase [Deltaproteobacteria bacterium RIFCSPLOWO2_12_FULL_42_16]OGQ72045.1 MAG: